MTDYLQEAKACLKEWGKRVVNRDYTEAQIYASAAAAYALIAICEKLEGVADQQGSDQND
jgi:hypothetical protein